MSTSDAQHRQLISVIVPVLNEEENVEAAYKAIREVFETELTGFDMEIVFTDNHSSDDTFAKITAIASEDKRVRAVRFTRNFGFNKSILTGYRLARGDAAIQIDCDLQDPPALIPKFIALWKQGHDVVIGLRKQRPEPAWLLAIRKSYYRFLAKISSENIVLDGGDFRLVDRSVLNQLVRLQEATPYVRGIISSLASNQTGFEYQRTTRAHGSSKFPISRLSLLALDGIISHSTLPLRLASLFGLAIGASAMLLAIFYVVARLAFGFEMPPGFATTTILELLSISVNAVFLGIIGEYLARIHMNLRGQPLTTIEAMLNLDTKEKQRTLPIALRDD